jgi:hypothetical protein
VGFKFGNSEFYLPQLPAISATQVVFHCDAHLPVPFRDWLAAWIRGKALPADCAICLYKYNGEEAERIELKQAVLSGLGFPALDAVSTDLGHLTVTMQAASVTTKPGSGKKAEVSYSTAPVLWRRRDFRISIDGTPSTKVSQTDAIQVSSPGGFPNLNFLVGTSEGPGFQSLKQSGKPAPAKLRFLFPDLKKVFLTLEFTTLVVSLADSAGLAPVPGGRGTQPGSIAKIPVELAMTDVSLTTA